MTPMFFHKPPFLGGYKKFTAFTSWQAEFDKTAKVFVAVLEGPSD